MTVVIGRGVSDSGDCEIRMLMRGDEYSGLCEPVNCC